jgi:CYTH domain-containing protein
VPVEIERKFLVTGSGWRQGHGVRLSQGYLNRDKERTVRIRLAGERAFLTIKGASSGATRAEFEYEIPVADAEELLKLCDGPIIQKVRHTVAYKGLEWEIDEFLGDNAGLVVAEVELEREDQPFERPGWVGQEVTEDPRYYNSSLAASPYSTWRESPDR